MVLVIVHAVLGDRRFHVAPRRGALAIGSAREGDVQLTGHNIASRHVILSFLARGRVTIDVRSPYGVRINGRLPRAGEVLVPGELLVLGPWEIRLEDEVEVVWSAAEEDFFEAFVREPPANDARLVYADWLEDRGRLPEASVVRATLDGKRPPTDLAARTPPGWRRRLVASPVEGCAREGCARVWDDLPAGPERGHRPCGTCGLRVTYASDIGTARQLALQGKPVAIDPAVHREPDDLREPARKRLAVEMGRPTR